jgi:spore germination cell wall hydrolase CwlJ-like protein
MLLRESYRDGDKVKNRTLKNLSDWPAERIQLLRAVLRGEPFEGKIAIACVIRNRVNNPGWWGRDVVSVCTAPAQFTCWHDGQAARVRALALGLSTSPLGGSEPEGSKPRSRNTEPEGDETDAAFAQCLDIARDVLAGAYRDHTGGADHYHTASMDLPPPWARGKTPLIRIGAHLFYKLGLDGKG